MKPIHCAQGLNAVIPDCLKEIVINTAWLNDHNACIQGRSAFLEQFPNGATYHETREWIAEIQRQDWEDWMKQEVGGDVATAGNRGTATAGNRGTATAGYAGTATAGDAGTATAGDAGTATAGNRGTATAGDAGTATAGDDGTATAGYRGTATAGYAGVISIRYWDNATDRYRVMIGYIGEGGLQAGVAYKLNEQAQFEPVEKAKADDSGTDAPPAETPPPPL